MGDMMETLVAEVPKEGIEIPKEDTQAVLNLEELTTRAKQLEADLEASRREAKSHQEYGRKQKEALERQRGLEAEIAELKNLTKVQTEMIAAIMDKEGGEEEEITQPRQRKSEEYLARIKQPTVIDPRQEAFSQVAEEADGLIKSVGLDMEKSPELRNAFRLFRSGIRDNYYIGDAQDGLEEVKKVVEAKKAEITPKTEPKTEAKKEELSDEDKERIAREYMIKHGLLTSDTGLPSGSFDSDAEFKKKWGSGELPATKENFNRARKLQNI